MPRTIGEDGAVVFGTVSFQVDPSYAIEEKGNLLRIVYEEKHSFGVVTASETLTTEEGSALEGMMPALTLQGYISSFDKVTNQQNADLTIAGTAAKAATFIAEVNGNFINCMAVSFDVGAYNYLVAFTESGAEKSHTKDFQALLESIAATA